MAFSQPPVTVALWILASLLPVSLLHESLVQLEVQYDSFHWRNLLHHTCLAGAWGGKSSGHDTAKVHLPKLDATGALAPGIAEARTEDQKHTALT